MIKRIYLDVCTLCRPHDDQSQMRIRLETDAYFLILQSITNNVYNLMVSPVHFAEISDISILKEKAALLVLLDKYGHSIKNDLSTIRSRAELLNEKFKFGIADAAHAAFAEATADAFITCDDKLLKKCKNIKLEIHVFNPIEFCIFEDLK